MSDEPKYEYRIGNYLITASEPVRMFLDNGRMYFEVPENGFYVNAAKDDNQETCMLTEDGNESLDEHQRARKCVMSQPPYKT